MCSLTSTATWSLRERPVWIFLPRSPSFSVSMRSTAMWTSWSSTRILNPPASASFTIRPSSRRTLAASALVTIGRFRPFISDSIVTCAAVPMQSHFASARSSTGSSPTVYESMSGSTVLSVIVFFILAPSNRPSRRTPPYYTKIRAEAG